MRIYKVDVDKGKVDYLDGQYWIQEYRFLSFYQVCELVFARHLPEEDLLLDVLAKEKVIPILDCYMEQLVTTFLKTHHDQVPALLQLTGSIFSYAFVQTEVKLSLKRFGLDAQIEFLIPEEKEKKT